ncbi:MAG: type II toxin-antitoxin system HicA family toxin [Nostocales cyanobacterium ELA583]|jgi:predicted RNA binding protein YcfA (HicA-like mRNA interferase family)
MGRLAGFSYREVTKQVGKLGFQFYRSAKGDYKIWKIWFNSFNSETNQKTTIPHREIKEGTLKNILKQAQADVFLDI